MMDELSGTEKRAWELWRENHLDNKDITRWDQVPYWEQRAYIHYLTEVIE